jgi:hypothetical protein
MGIIFPSKEVEQQYERLLEEMRHHVFLTTLFCQMTATFLKVTASYWPELFHCYDVVDLPRTNNDLEHVFGSTRYHERCPTGRKQASPGLVVRGSVRIVATIVTQNNHFSGSDLALAIWRNGERSENRSTIVTKPDVNNIVFGKTQSATYMLWRSNYPRKKCSPSFFCPIRLHPRICVSSGEVSRLWGHVTQSLRVSPILMCSNVPP